MNQAQTHAPLRLLPFPPTTQADWQKQALREIRTKNLQDLERQTREGFSLAPMYMEDSSLPPQDFLKEGGFRALFQQHVRKQGMEHSWLICQTIDCHDANLASAMAKAEVEGGAQALWLDLSTRSANGIRFRDKQELYSLLQRINIDATPLIFASEYAALPFAAMLNVALLQQGKKLIHLRGAIANDPLAALALHGSLGIPIEQCFDDTAHLCQWTMKQAPHLRTIIVANDPYHDADMDTAWEVAISLASGLEYLRQLTNRGLTPLEMAKQIFFKVSVGSEFLLEIGKLRALRLLWLKILAASGVDESGQNNCFIHAQSSRRDLPTIEATLNLIRTTLYGIAAVLGGADSISISPYLQTQAGEQAMDARRYARNIQLLLQDEAHVDQVLDPVGGSWYIENLTDKLARAAWENLQEIEAVGGMLAALRSGFIHSKLAEQKDEKTSSGRVRSIIGVNRFVRENSESSQEQVSKKEQVSSSQEANVADKREITKYPRSYEAMVAAAQAGVSFTQLVHQSLNSSYRPTSIVPLALPPRG